MPTGVRVVSIARDSLSERAGCATRWGYGRLLIETGSTTRLVIGLVHASSFPAGKASDTVRSVRRLVSRRSHLPNKLMAWGRVQIQHCSALRLLSSSVADRLPMNKDTRGECGADRRSGPLLDAVWGTVWPVGGDHFDG